MNENFEDLRIIRLPEVKRFTGLGRSSIYKMMAAGIFPSAVHLTSRSIGWMMGDIRAWLQARKAS